MNRNLIGWILAFFSILIFSTNTPIARTIILDGMQPLTLAMLRFILATILFAIVLKMTGLGQPKEGEQPLDRRIILICLASGMVNGIVIICWYSALKTLDASMTSVLGIALFPTATLIILAFAGEKLTIRKGIRLILVFIGLALLIGLNGAFNWVGFSFVLIAAICYGFHLSTVQWFMQPYNTWATTGILMGGGAIIVTILWFVNGADLMIPGLKGWLVIAYQVIVLTFFGRTILYAAIERIGSGQFALISPLETVLTIIWSMLFLSETLTLRQWLGAGLILLSAMLVSRKQPSKPMEISAEITESPTAS